MRTTLSALATAAALSIAVAAIPQTAQAGPYHHWHGGGAFIGGLAAGAIIGGALAGPRYYGGPGYYGYYGGTYPYAYSQCWRDRVWTNHGWRWRRFCN